MTFALTMSAPSTFLGTPVPDDIAKAWNRWEGLEWRQMRHLGTNHPHPPDLRFGVRPPAELCAVHRQHWFDYREMRFDRETGNRWPGYDGSFLDPVNANLDAVREWRRVEWDRKASEQMRLIERICLRGDSPQCTPMPAPEPARTVVSAPRPARGVEDVPLPEPGFVS